jgi:LPPG:FO 2-phospho-L-lactate transferase
MKIAALAGGVGGAKLADGLAQILSPENLTIIVNTGDDFEHLGLFISPDLDTVCYTLAGLANPETGWGRREETFNLLENLQKLGGPDWFLLGDRDMATHLERTRRMRGGQPLSQITNDFCRAWGVDYSILPMSDQPVHTMVETAEDGELAFQDYFVKRKCTPVVKGFRFAGIETASPAPGVLDVIKHADAVIICPSNPWVSIDTILAIPGVRPALSRNTVVAVSPIIGGRTIKGPAAKMFIELGLPPTALSVARHFDDILSGFILDNADSDLAQYFSVPTVFSNILMKNQFSRKCLAQDVLNLIRTL